LVDSMIDGVIAGAMDGVHNFCTWNYGCCGWRS